MCFPGESVVKNLPPSYRDAGLILQEDPLEEEMATLPRKSHGQMSLAGYSPQSHKSQIRLNDYTTTITKEVL